MLRQSFLVMMFALLAMPTFAIGQEVAGPDGEKLYVRVTLNREISGLPIDLIEIKVSTSFGEVSVPMAKVEGIKMHADSDDSAMIAFRNGDVVTGKVNLDKIKLKTDWGVAHVNTAQIDQITTTRSARFYPDSSGGTKGWRFAPNAVSSSGSSTTNANFNPR